MTDYIRAILLLIIINRRENKVHTRNNNNNNNNSIRVYLRANLTAQMPITKLAPVHRNTQK
jgi:hypothetical protein